MHISVAECTLAHCQVGHPHAALETCCGMRETVPCVRHTNLHASMESQTYAKI